MTEKEYLFELLKKYNFFVSDIREHTEEGIFVLLGFYAYQLLSDIQSGNDLSRHLAFIREAYQCPYSNIAEAIEIEVFETVFTELGENNKLENLLEGSLLKAYRHVVQRWLDLNSGV